MPTITAGFNDFEMAVKAGGALLDHGVDKKHFDLLAGRAHEGRFHAEGRHLEDLENKVEGGVTTTTSADAAEGAAAPAAGHPSQDKHHGCTLPASGGDGAGAAGG